MLLGYFFRQISEMAPRLVELRDVEPGSVVVAVEQLSRLRETGLPCVIRFGIAVSEDQVICRCCECEDIENPSFVVKSMSCEEFCSPGMSMYECRVESSSSRSMIILRAKMYVGIRTDDLCSYPGDDFAAFCVSGLEPEELAEKLPDMGQHRWTPLKMRLRESLTWLGWKTPAGWLPQAADVQVFDQTHHGISIEAQQVIHFSTRRVPDGTNCIKTDSLQEFNDIDNGEVKLGAPVLYKEETTEQRLRCRNRAVWVFCHADRWGGYDLFSNNCEHFSRFCRVGKKESRQVIAAVVGAFSALLSMLPRSLPYRPLIGALSIMLNNVARLAGKPASAKEKLPLKTDSRFLLL